MFPSFVEVSSAYSDCVIRARQFEMAISKAMNIRGIDLRGGWVRYHLLRGFGANAVSQLTAMVLQFAAVPIYLSHWGAAKYGIWIVAFTVPNYIALLDIGFATAAGNDMTLAAARGDYDHVN